MSSEKTFEAALRVCSSIRTASDIASRLPIKPSRLVEKDSASPTTRTPRAASDARWILDSGLADATPIEDHIHSFVRLLEQHAESFKKLPDDCEIDVWCTISSSEKFAGFSVDWQLIERLAAYHVGLVFSVYAGQPKDS